MSFEIALRVDPKAAILGGKTAFGIHRVTVDDAFLERLPQEQREELANIVTAGEIVGGQFALDDEVQGNDDPVAAADLPTLAKLLQQRVEQRVVHREWKTQQEKDQEDARRREEQAVLVARKQTEANLVAQMQAIHRWVEEHGDDDQKERLKEGTLPDGEILHIVREQLFEPLDGHVEYSRMRQRDVCNCACLDSVVFTREAVDHLKPEQHRRLVNIRSEAPGNARVKPRRHKGACDQCDCPEVVQVTAHVEVDWNTVVLGKEYILDD